MTLASGGHPPALLLRADGAAEYLPTPGGVARRRARRTARSHRDHRTLDPGDTLLLYTDGLTEARIAARRRPLRRRGPAGVRRAAPARAHETVEALTGLLESFGDGLDDDTALLALGVPPDREGTQSAAKAPP